jgi:hypothetical protein
MHVEMCRNLGADLLKELLELDHAVTSVHRTDSRCHGGVERSEQSGGAVVPWRR